MGYSIDDLVRKFAGAKEGHYRKIMFAVNTYGQIWG